MTPIGVHDADEIERGITEFARGSNGGLIVVGPPSSVAPINRDLIITLAAQHHLPAVYATPAFVSTGALISYGPDPITDYRRAAGYVDRILKGEKPADLPVQAPTKYELVVNLKTAKALGLAVPQSDPRSRRRGDRISVSHCVNRRWQSDVMGHELPRRQCAVATAMPPIPDTKASDWDGGHRPSQASRSHDFASAIGGTAAATRTKRRGGC